MSETRRFCPKCGKEVPAEARFCDKCGTNIAEATPAETTEASQVQQEQGVPLQTEQSEALRPAVDPQYSFSPAEMFIDAAAAPGGAGLNKWTKPLSAILAVLLVLSVFVNALRGTIYRAVVRLNVEKLYDEFYDEFGRNNPMLGLLDDMFYYGSITDIRIDDIVEFLDSRKVKRAVQTAANSVFDMMLTGNPKRLVSEDRLERLVKSLASEINSKLGIRLSNSDVEDVVQYIVSDYLYSIYGENDRYAREMIEDFWEYTAPDGLRTLRPPVHPATKNVLTILCILAIIVLILINLRRLGAATLYIGVPLVISGIFAGILVLLTGVWARIIAERMDITARIARFFLSGYSGTAFRYAFMFIIIGAILSAIGRKSLKASV